RMGGETSPKLSQSKMMEMQSKPIYLALILHTSVDHLHRQGAGIGVVQRVECAMTGITKSQLIPSQQRKYSFTREKLVVDNVKTAGRAEMLAVVHALGLARATMKRGCPKTAQVQRVNVFSDSLKAVQTINYHLKHGLESLDGVKSTNDGSMIKRVVTKVRELSRLGLEVAVAMSDGKDKAEAKARTIARQKGRKACKSRHRLRLAHANLVKSQQETAGDREACDLASRPKIHDRPNTTPVIVG
ncbi:hypothetical protein H2200_009156, partial [Cladophialophora chaetospira]